MRTLRHAGLLPSLGMLIVIFAGTNGYLDDLPVEDGLVFERGLFDFLDSSYPNLGNQLREKKQIDDSLRAEIRKVLDEFKAKFVADRKAKVEGIPDTESAVTPDLLEDA